MIKTRKQLIKEFIEFYKTKNHKEIPNVSLIPENDPTTLFIGSGVETIIPYVLGQPHPLGKRLTNVQKSIRTQDIEEVGDEFHHTLFEMLGNWSLGDYWKEDAIKMTYEFLTKILNIPQEKLAATCFKGDKIVSKDAESEKIYLELGFPKERIAFLSKKDNFWGPAGKTGPCGPNTEIFYWKSNSKPPKKFDPEDDNWLEIGNNVLMQYNKNEKGELIEQNQKTVDFGGGVERIISTLNNLEDSYLADYFFPIIKKIENLSNKSYKGNERAMRIIADHIKASVFIIADGITPSNVEQGYVLRRLIRRAIRYTKNLGIPKDLDLTTPLVKEILKIYDDYEILKKNKQKIVDELNKEEDAFEKTLEKGLRQSEKIFKTKTSIKKEKFIELMKNPNKSLFIRKIFDLKNKKKDYSIKNPKLSKKEIDNATISGEESFLLSQSYGFPLEMINELAMAKGLLVDHNAFKRELQKHQELSRTSTQGKFKSGLVDNSESTKKLHTATHLLNQALRIVLKKPDIFQKGSNITPERLRFDFNFDRKLSEKEIREVEDLVNKKIKEKIFVICDFMRPKEAKKIGAQGVFDEKYGEKVSVYSVGDFSKEICAGPHVDNTCELGKFKIIKQEGSAAGVRRIKARLE